MIIRVKTRYDKDAVGNNADLTSKTIEVQDLSRTVGKNFAKNSFSSTNQACYTKEQQQHQQQQRRHVGWNKC